MRTSNQSQQVLELIYKFKSLSLFSLFLHHGHYVPLENCFETHDLYLYDDFTTVGVCSAVPLLLV